MTIAQIIRQTCPPNEGRKVLAFGNEAREVALTLVSAGWSAVTVLPYPAKPMNGERLIASVVTDDFRIVRTLEGHWSRSVSLTDIFVQFPGPYDVIMAINTARDRMIWYHECIFNALPRMYVLGEDGHNEDVVKRARERGYRNMEGNGCLILTHE